MKRRYTNAEGTDFIIEGEFPEPLSVYLFHRSDVTATIRFDDESKLCIVEGGGRSLLAGDSSCETLQRAVKKACKLVVERAQEADRRASFDDVVVGFLNSMTPLQEA